MQNNGNLQISQQETQREKQLWVIDQLTVLAEAFAEPMTPERYRIYAQELADLQRSALAAAFMRARRELTFFPKIAELRSLARQNAEKERRVEADAAWDTAESYLAKYGVDLLPINMGGRLVPPPPLNPQIEYALRRIGGLRGLNRLTEKNLPFARRDFAEAYNDYPLAEQLSPSLKAAFTPPMLRGKPPRLLAEGICKKGTNNVDDHGN